MEEMMEDVLDMEEDEELEEEADAEVDKVLFELTNGKLGQAGIINNEIPVRIHISFTEVRFINRVLVLQTAEDQRLDEETERNIEKYREQLNGILS